MQHHEGITQRVPLAIGESGLFSLFLSFSLSLSLLLSLSHFLSLSLSLSLFRSLLLSLSLSSVLVLKRVPFLILSNVGPCLLQDSKKKDWIVSTHLPSAAAIGNKDFFFQTSKKIYFGIITLNCFLKF